MNTEFQTVTFSSTNNFSLFHFLNFNRKVNMSHVKGLKALIEANGFKGVIQVIKTDILEGVMRYYILDGQHRFTACKMLDIPFNFEITELKTKKEVADFISGVNTSAKAWGTNQFLNVWSALHIVEYVKLAKVARATKIQITPLIEIYGNTKKMDSFRAGTIQFQDEAESDLIVKQLMELDEFLSSKSFCRRAIIQVMRLDGYKHSKMLKAVKNHLKTIGKFSESEKDLKAELISLM